MKQHAEYGGMHIFGAASCSFDIEADSLRCNNTTKPMILA